MLRPSPTTIDLSANDVSEHLQKIDIYRGLLKQGFKKRDIQRYFREQRNAANDGTSHLLSPTSLRAPTWVDLAKHHSRTESSVKSHCSPISKTMSSIESSTSTASSTTTEDIDDEHVSRSLNRIDVSTTHHSHKESRTSDPSEFPKALNTVDSVNELDMGSRAGEALTDQLERACLPRRTSLLRYSSKIPSDEMVEMRQPSFPSVSFHSQMRYRSRTNTYSYQQSDIDDGKSESSSILTEFGDLILDNSLVSTKQHISQPSRLRGDAKEFILQNAHSVHSTPKTCTVNSLEPNNDLTKGLPLASPVDTSRIVPTLTIRKSKRQRPVVDFSSSPPLPTTSRSAAVESAQASSPTLPLVPSTPRNQPSAQDPWTDPYHTRFRYLNGTSFTPYNDSIPANRQPQTPADLARTPMIDEHNATYTAPPGRLRNDITTPQSDHRNNLESGQESPTNRAISMRQRRNREFARSARIEGLRIHRMRRHHYMDASWEAGEQLNLWRDDLDADRVGEENFDNMDGLPDNTSVRIRVVSGNRHANAI